MKELIKVTTKGNQQLVDARELHVFLEITSKFADWIKNSINDFGFVDNVDYSTYSKNLEKGRPTKEYALSLDMAKELSMLARNGKGKQARQYFIAMEKKALHHQLPQTFSEALLLAGRQAEQIEQQQLQLNEANQTIEKNKSKVVFAETVKGSNNSILVREYAKLLQNSGINMGQNKLFTWLRENGYLMQNNEPYQNYIAQGLFEVIERIVGDSDNTITVRTTKISGKGQTYFMKKIILQ